MAPDEEKALEERASSRARLLRDRAASLPPNSSDMEDVREGVAASAELGILVLQKTNSTNTLVQLLQKDVEFLRRRVEQLEDPERRATEILFEERRSKLGLEEEVTRADLDLKKLRTEHRQKIFIRILAAVMTPPGLWSIWEWLQQVFF